MKKSNMYILAGIVILLAITGILVVVSPPDFLSWPQPASPKELIVWIEPESRNQPARFAGIDNAAVYTLPFGGFEFSAIGFCRYPDLPSVSDMNYTFYPRSWGPGNVSYKIDVPDNCREVLSNGTLIVNVQPSSFIAEPYHQYTSRVHVEISPPFETTIIKCGYQGQMRIRMNVTLEDHSINLGNDSLNIITPEGQVPGYASTQGSDFFSIDGGSIFSNNKIDLKPGETARLNWTYSRGETGFGERSFRVSATPLNVTIEPARILTNMAVQRYPGVIEIHADRDLEPGTYPFYFKLEGGHGVGMDMALPSLFTVNVTAPEPEVQPP